MHERHLAVRMSFAYHFQTVGDIYVIFWELLAQVVTSLFLLLLQLQKTKLHPYVVHICFFLLSLLSSFRVLWRISTTFYRGKLSF